MIYIWYRVQNRERTQIVPIELPCIHLHCYNEILPQCHIARLRNCHNAILPHYQIDCHAIKGVRAYKREQVGADNLPCKYQTNQPQRTKYTNSKYPTALNTCGGGQSGRESFLLACLPDDWEQARTGFQMKSPTRSAPAFKLFSISAQNSRGVLTEIEIELMSVLSPFQWWLWIAKVPQLWNKLLSLWYLKTIRSKHMILLKEWKNRDFKSFGKL